MNMDALLRIQAKVTGAEQISQLQGKFKQVEGAASSLTNRAGLLSGALGSLAPVVTIGGLGALVSKTIEAGDAMNDMSQRTGVSVEALARFKKAAATSGTDIDSVAKSLGRLSKGMYEASSTGKGPAAEALKTLGISATDAAGKLKSADRMTLEIANRFKAMPDGVEKTALAMQLFGKSGADMIPMLNMGGDAIDKLSVKMTTAFAQKADQYKDKLAVLSGKVGGLAAGLTVALLPALDAVATGLTAVVDGFAKLPAPVQAVVGGLALLAVSAAALAPIFASIVTVAGAFEGLAIGATIAGWLGAIGPLIATVGTFVAGIISWPVVVGAALVAVGLLIYKFRAQIGAAISSVGEALAQPFIAAGNVIKSVLRNVLGFAVGAINGFLGVVNQMLGMVNGVASRLRLPQLPTMGLLAVPQFATGAYVTGPTMAQFGEAGPEYAIPASKMQSASLAYLNGARGAAVLQGGGGGGGGPQITIQTGQVLQLPDASQWVSMADLEQAMRATAAGVLGQLRSPAGRVAMGGA